MPIARGPGLQIRRNAPRGTRPRWVATLAGAATRDAGARGHLGRSYPRVARDAALDNPDIRPVTPAHRSHPLIGSELRGWLRQVAAATVRIRRGRHGRDTSISPGGAGVSVRPGGRRGSGADSPGRSSEWDVQARTHAGILFVSTRKFRQDRRFVGAIVTALGEVLDAGGCPCRRQPPACRTSAHCEALSTSWLQG